VLFVSAPPMAGTMFFGNFPLEALGVQMVRKTWFSRYTRYVPVLCCETGLCEVVLQVFDAPEGHDTLSLRRTPAERFRGFG
jgi:hypothetical protein